jgi:alginate production protein
MVRRVQAFICLTFVTVLLFAATLSYAEENQSEESNDELRKRLTERVDKRRPVQPFSFDVGGRPLTLTGSYEINLDYPRSANSKAELGRRDRLLLDHGVEAESYYPLSPQLSLFAQLRFAQGKDLLSGRFERIADRYLERGEMWLHHRNIGGSRFSLDIGRLDFEDDRRWWWDEKLDAFRITHERGDVELSLAFAQELASERSDRNYIAPERQRVRRLIGEASWDWQRNHALQFFLLHQNDGSRQHTVGDVVENNRRDESDATLTWVGARASGAFNLAERGIIGYWLDGAVVRGKEQRLAFEAIDGNRSVVDNVLRQRVRGWGYDTGVSWIIPAHWETRLYAGYAYGSGDSNSDDDTDRAFRQTGLAANEAGFGGVQRFAHYGLGLNPELSNLKIATIGAGLNFLKASSVDLVYHRYRLAHSAESLRNARIGDTLVGKDIGCGVDLVLAIEEWEQFDFEFSVSAFRAGRGFGDGAGKRSYFGFAGMRIAF